jgi:ABC-2 type transport system ATP-binding protein
VDALRGLTFSVNEGEIFGLVGPDGAGKTTCLRILCGLMRPTAGKAFVLGHDVALEPAAIKSRIGYMAQPAKLYEDLTVLENIEFYADLYHLSHPEYETRLARLLRFSGLEAFGHQYFRNLSGGMKQKVGLMCALIHKPQVLLLDEPTNGVDPVSRRDFWKILYELRRDRVSIVLASAYMDEVERCHRVAFLHQGEAEMVVEPFVFRRRFKGKLHNFTRPCPKSTIRVFSARASISPS